MSSPIQPVAPWACSLGAAPMRPLELHEVDAGVLASLVRTRLALERGRGWLLLSGLVVTVGSVVLLGMSVHNKLMLGVLAPLSASVPFCIGLFADRACRLAFDRIADGQGLSAQAVERLYEGALGADHWIAVLTACGRAPSDTEIAGFLAQATAPS